MTPNVSFFYMYLKTFQKDRNYILRNVQYERRESLSRLIITQSIENYLCVENPLGIEDSFIKQLKKIRHYNIEFVYDFYKLASNIYRYSVNINQLEFIWDGSSHDQKYEQEWRYFLIRLIADLAHHKSFNRIIIKGAVVYGDQENSILKTTLLKILSAKFPRIYTELHAQLRLTA